MQIRDVMGALVGVAVVVAVAAAPALAASTGYLKIEGIDGEAKGQQAGDRKVQAPQPKPQGLLLPAVQKAQPDQPQPKPRKGGVGVAAGDVNGDGR